MALTWLVRLSACRIPSAVACAIALTGSLESTSIGAQSPAQPPQCRLDGRLATIAELREASGLAVSRRVPGRLWAHNDSGQPVLYALDTSGSVTGRLTLSGARVEDWEAVAAGPCPAGSCLYVADIGDNDAARRHITIYRVEEPSGPEGSVEVKDVFHATYPDGAHDAETLLVTSQAELFIVTKGDTGAVGLYRFPKQLRAGATHPLERVGNLRGQGKPAASERITDGAVSSDGRWTALRTGGSLSFHPTSELLAGNWRESSRVGLEEVGEAQGEGIAIAADGTVYLAGEGGGKSRPGTFARLRCSS
jgi:hypothetical protein